MKNQEKETWISERKLSGVSGRPSCLYEVGYPKCVCPEVLGGETADAAHCECSRQSVLYILEQLLPERHITVRTVETVLGGGTCCRFAVTVE